MADPKTRTIFEQGAAAWNAWRQENPRLRADLRRLDLRGVDLRRVDLAGVDLASTNMAGTALAGRDLRGTMLSGANLRGADLSGALLAGANLSGAVISGAFLRHTDLRGANLRGSLLCGATLAYADLTEADCRDADLRGADLSHCTLTGVRLSRAHLAGADLTGANYEHVGINGARFEPVEEQPLPDDTIVLFLDQDVFPDHEAGSDSAVLTTLLPLLAQLRCLLGAEIRLELESIRRGQGDIAVFLAIRDSGAQDLESLRTWLQQQAITLQRQIRDSAIATKLI